MRVAAAIVLQLAHAGLQAATPLTKMEAIGPSDMADENGATGREMTLAEIEQTIEAFVAAAGPREGGGIRRRATSWSARVSAFAVPVVVLQQAGG